MRDMNPYTGWRTNCYATSLGMLLSRKGNPKPIPYIDCLTTLPFGPFIYLRKIGFAVMGIDPEKGVDHALSLLGYECLLTFGDSEKEAIEKLKNNLKKDWILIGPVDMSYLTYDPFCKKKKGADHYIVAVDFDNDFIWINDPEGYIEVPLSWRDFLKAWEAKRIYYKKASYTQRLLGEKVAELTEEEIFKSVLEKVSRIFEGENIPPGALYGEEAIRSFADDLTKKGVSMLELTFTLPVCNQRCYDSSIFLAQESFTNKALKEASKVRMRQARLFGKCRLFAAKKDTDALCSTLKRIADLDISYGKMLIEGVSALRR